MPLRESISPPQSSPNLKVTVHAYVDHAVVEVIANATFTSASGDVSDESTPIAAWVAPTSAASSGVALFSEVEGVTLVALDVWQLASPKIRTARRLRP